MAVLGRPDHGCLRCFTPRPREKLHPRKIYASGGGFILVAVVPMNAPHVFFLNRMDLFEVFFRHPLHLWCQDTLHKINITMFIEVLLLICL